MRRQLAFALPTFALAFLILSLSVLQASAIEYQFSTPRPSPMSSKISLLNINPSHPFWIFKALKDKVTLELTLNSYDKAKLLLSLANERLRSAQALFENGEPELGASVITKSEKYLELASQMQERAQKEGANTSEFLKDLFVACDTHKKTIDNLVDMSPEEAKPLLVKFSDYPKRLLGETQTLLYAYGITPSD